MIRVCVLGSIGSGKSFISKLFNCPIFNADREVNYIYKNDINCFKKLKKKLPKYIKSYPIKKKELINAIVSKKNNLKLISSVVHPIVRKRMKIFLDQKKSSKIVVLDVPLLIENKLNQKNDFLLFVNAHRSKILARLKKRKYFDKEIHKTQNQNQATMLRKREIANYIIDNNFSPNIMKNKINKLKRRILDERNCT